MLLTFPTKESLIRNLNEMNSEDIFLIIANYKTLKSWNLVPLKKLSLILGPNSSGKSTIYDAIQIIRNFGTYKLTDLFYEGSRFWGREDYVEDITDTHIGFSMPFIYNNLIENIDLWRMLTETPQYTSKSIGHNNVYDSFLVDGVNTFILQGMLGDGCLNCDLKKTRYSLIASANMNKEDSFNDQGTYYEVYLDNELASKMEPPDEHPGVKVEITQCAHDLIFNPFLNDGHRCEYTGEKFNEKLVNIINYPWSNYRFKQDLPSLIMHDTLILHDFDGQLIDLNSSKEIVFCMVLALYHVTFHQFFDIVGGYDSADLRVIDSRWYDSDDLWPDGAWYFEKNQSITPELNILFENELFHRTHLDTINHNLYNSDWISKVVNRWLSEKAFFDSNYQLEIDLYKCLRIDNYNRNNSLETGLNKFRAYLIDKSGRELNFKQVGTGFSQIIPILIGLVSKAMLVFKQPEVHLHPRLQSRAADCFVETIFNDRLQNNSNIRIIETHSEHFVLRLLRRLRESKFDEIYHSSLTLYPEDIAFVYFQPLNDSTLVHYIPVTPDGEFVDGWPDGFFDERDEDLWDEFPAKGQ